MSDKLFTILIIIFSLLTIIFPVLLFTFLPFSEILFSLLQLDLLVTVIPIITLISIKYKDQRRFRKAIWLIFIAGVIFSILLAIIIDIGLIALTSIFVFTCLSIAALIIYPFRTNLFVFLLVGIALISLIMKRYHLAGTSQIIYLSHMTLATAFVMIGIRSVFFIKNNRSLFIISITCSLIICISCLFIILKILQIPGADLFYTLSIIPVLLMTVIVLISLPQSGYINWNKDHKNLLLKTLLIPWIYVLLFTSARFALPSKTLDTIFEGSEKQKIHFNMVEYEAEKAGDSEGR